MVCAAAYPRAPSQWPMAYEPTTATAAAAASATGISVAATRGAGVRSGAAVRSAATTSPVHVPATRSAVNLSASDLLDESLAERIAGLLAEHAVPATALELEITESVIMIDPKRAREVLEALRALGLRIAVDDYGTGYCALAYLRDLPIDELKIDRSFIANVTTDRRSAAIVRSTIELAHALSLKVVAEGIEHEQALAALAAFGCDFAQGYHFSRPLPADAFTAWIHERVAGAAPRCSRPSARSSSCLRRPPTGGAASRSRLPSRRKRRCAVSIRVTSSWAASLRISTTRSSRNASR